MVSYASKTLSRILKEPFSLDIERLQKEKTKLNTAIDLIGRDYYRTGEDAKEFNRNAINCLATINHICLPYPEGPIPDKKAGYYFINPSRIRDSASDSGLIVEKILPEPEKAISFIEKAVDEYLFNLQDFNYLPGFQTKKSRLVSDFSQLKKKINVPYTSRRKYEPIREGLSKVVSESYNLEKEYKSAIEDLETKKYLAMAKSGLKVSLAAAASIILATQLKKVKALKIIANAFMR